MECGIRREGRRALRRDSERAGTVLQLSLNATFTEGKETVERLRRVRVRDTFYELMDSSDCVRADVLSGVVEDQTEHHVVQRL